MKRHWVWLWGMGVIFWGSLCRPPVKPEDRPSDESPSDTLPFFVENLSKDTAFSVGLELAVQQDGVMLGCWHTLLWLDITGERVYCRLREGGEWGEVMEVDTAFAFGVAWDRGEGFWLAYQLERPWGEQDVTMDLFVRHFDPVTGWGDRAILTDTGGAQEYVEDPWVVVDSFGGVHVVYYYQPGRGSRARTAYRNFDGTSWGSREEIGTGYNRDVAVTPEGEVWVVQVAGENTAMLARRVGKENWEVWTREIPWLWEASLNVDLLGDGDVLVTWMTLRNGLSAIVGMLRSTGWVPETLRPPGRMGYYGTGDVRGDTVLLVWTGGVNETTWVYASLWVKGVGMLGEHPLVGFPRTHLPVSYRPVVWGDTAYIPFANDHEGNFEVYVIHVPMEVLRGKGLR